MSLHPIARRVSRLAMFCIALSSPAVSELRSESISEETIAELDEALAEAGESSSEARKRLAVRRVIRDAEELVESHPDRPERFRALEFLFRARQQLIAMDDDSRHREALLETSRQLLEAPDEYAELKFNADLLLSQTELAKKGATAEEKAASLRPFVERYLDTAAGPKALRVAMVMAIEMGEARLIADLREIMARRYAADHEMINFQRDKLGGQVLGVPMAGTFQRSDGKTMRLPMDLLGRATMVIFWSKEGEGLDYIKGLATAAREAEDEQKGRMGYLSINVDDLPDAGESIIRELEVDWPVLHLPGGRDHRVYKAYAREDPKMLNVTPTGQTALVMKGVGRVRTKEDGSPDFHRYFGSALARGWSRPEYAMQVAALMAGDFLVFDPEGRIDPTRPPELKAEAMGNEVKALSRTANSLPEEKLAAIQEAIVAPPHRYRLTYPQAESAYAGLADLCRRAIAAHPDAPDLWIARNRLMIAHLGMWKTTGKLAHFESAVAEARTALDAGYPDGGDVVARFCLARAALREAGDKSGELIDRFVAENGGESAPGPVLATALLLALDVADRLRIEALRDTILRKHTEYPMMWIFSAALLDRHHDYWMFQVPFTAGWSYGRRQNYFASRGIMEEARRSLKAELQAGDGKSFRIPGDLDHQWTIITFSVPPPWQQKRDDGLPASPDRALSGLTRFGAERPEKDVQVMLATLGGAVEESRAELAGNQFPVECPVVTIPGGLENPLVHRLGIVAEEFQLNRVLIRKDGRIGGVQSGLVGTKGAPLQNIILNQDEETVVELLEQGEVEAARTTIMTLAPPYDPEAVDEKGRKLKKPNHSTPHLRARARVYLALGELDKALADAEEVYSRTFSESGSMSMRTEELDEAEALRDEIEHEIEKAGT